MRNYRGKTFPDAADSRFLFHLSEGITTSARFFPRIPVNQRLITAVDGSLEPPSEGTDRAFAAGLPRLPFFLVKPRGSCYPLHSTHDLT